MPTLPSDFIETVPFLEERLREFKELFLANAVMLSEIPSPTFKEASRMRFLNDRFIEAGLEHLSIDEMGSCTAVLPGKTGERAILVSANADTVFAEAVDHSVAVHANTITGPGLCDNSLGLAALATLPLLLDKLGIHLDKDIVLLADARSMGRGNLAGLRFFLENQKFDLCAAIALRGVQLGRLSFSSLGMLRGEITVGVPAEYDWQRFGSSGAISIMNTIVTRLLAIPVPQKPKTTIFMGAISAGTSHNAPATQANLKFEVRSEEGGKIEEIKQLIEGIVEEISSFSQTKIKFEVIARRRLGGIPFSHPLVGSMREILKSLDIQDKIAPSVGSLSELIDHKIPAVTIGLTRGHDADDFAEVAEIDPIFKGLAQLIAMIQAIDKGYCDET